MSTNHNRRASILSPFSTVSRICTAATITILATTSSLFFVDGFQPSCLSYQYYYYYKSSSTTKTQIYSSTGDDGPRPPSDDDDDGKGEDGIGDFLNLGKESDGLKKAREFMSETSLPISFELQQDENMNDDDDEEEQDPGDGDVVNDDDVYRLMDNDDLVDDDEEPVEDSTSSPSSSSAMIMGGSGGTNSSDIYDKNGLISEAALAKNPYMQVVSKLTPSQLISKFTATANPRVQEAVRTTILGLIGSLPKMAFDTTTITSGERLASLMFQLQMTGYMFKNAEYRLSMSQSLGMMNGYTSNLLLTGTVDDDDDDDDDEDDPLTSGKVKGKLKVHYGDEDTGMDIEVDAAAYMSELRSEVARLKEELAQSKEAKDAALKKDLLMYIRTLPRQELQSLTDTMSKDVLVCMKGLVQAVLGGIGDGQITAETVTEQSGEAMAQLCMWQLAVGYNLRELEVREEMKQNLKQILGGKDGGGGDGVDLSEPDAME